MIALIASGGMGGVYLAEDAAGNRVALKVLDAAFAASPDLVERLAGEREVSRRVGHTGLVKIHDCVRSPGQLPYLVMELIDGENLAAMIERGRIEIGAVTAIGAQLADALAAMHAAGIVHCDVKPENVMVLYRDGLAGWPQVKLTDFGVAQHDSGGSPRETGSDIIAGTPVYMAPEQWHGQVVAKTDVYALGCTLYELLTGSPPFSGTVPQLAVAHASDMPERPSRSRTGVPPGLDRLILRLLAKDPDLRPRMSEVARELADLAFGLPPGARAEQIRIAG